jgi:O-antigen/teichoic acid export membrane protein
MIAWDKAGGARQERAVPAQFGPQPATADVATLQQPPLRQLHQVGFSMADQALSVGGMFLVNLVLARTQSKEEYGRFALSYSVLVFLLGLQNAAILEPFTVFGSGRYRSRLAEYFQLMFWSNTALGLLLTALLLALCIAFRGLAPQWLPRGITGLGLTITLLLSGTLFRRVFYLQRRPDLAAAASAIFFLTVMAGLWLTAKTHVLNSLSVFLVLAAGWLAAGLGLAAHLPFGKSRKTFLECEPRYWTEHWEYGRWVLLTAFTFQLTTQGYYWLVAGFLSVRDVAELKAVALLVAPADQIFIALNYLVLPLLCSHYAARRMERLFSAWRWYAIAITAATLSFFLVLFAFGKLITHVLYSGRYDDAAPLLAWMLLVPVVMGIGHTMNAALKAAESPRLVFWAYAASAAVTFIAGVPLVARFGLRGAVFGMLLSGSSYTVAMAVGFVTRFSRTTPVPAVLA